MTPARALATAQGTPETVTEWDVRAAATTIRNLNELGFLIVPDSVGITRNPMATGGFSHG